MRVQQLIAILVLCVVGFLPAGNAVSGLFNGASTLPACCRTNGKHKCSMGVPTHSSVQPTVRSVCSAYPVVPPGTAVVPNVVVSAPASTAALTHDMNCANGVWFHPVARANVILNIGPQKRGPPSFLS